MEDTPPGYVPMREATEDLGVARSTVLKWIQSGWLEAVAVTRGRRRGFRIRLPDTPASPSLFQGIEEQESVICSESDELGSDRTDSESEP